MPELPEVETTKLGITPHLLEQTIQSATIRNANLRWPVSDEISRLSQTTVTDIRRRAKYLIIQTSKGSILIHLGMSGSLRVCPSHTKLRKHDHVIFHLETGIDLRYHDPRRFGCVLYSNDIENHQLLQKLGPEPLSDDFTASNLISSCSKTSKPIKPHLMTNSTVVGVGNIYACESLFLAGIHPTRLAKKIGKNRISKLHSTIRSVLASAIEQGGTTLRDFVKEDGSPGYFQQKLFTYGREGERCKRCSATIKKITQGQRSTFYCPQCQR